MPLPSIHPVRDPDLPELCAFLHRHLSDRISAAAWEQAFLQPWDPEKPNNGFSIRDDQGGLVGAIGAIYALRQVRGRPERFCNITSWCVLDAYRSQSMRLAMAVVSQPSMHFTDLTPTKVVAGSLSFLKFKPLDATATVLPHLPWPRLPGSARVRSKPEEIETLLSGDAARAYRDHRQFPWLKHLALGSPEGSCHLVYKPMKLKGLPVTKVLAVSDPEVFVRHFRSLGGWLLLHTGSLATWVERRLLRGHLPPGPTRELVGYRDKLFRSDSLQAQDFDNLYSELMALDL
jgi:hypothetical protein